MQKAIAIGQAGSPLSAHPPLRPWAARLAIALSCIMRLTKFLIVLHRYAMKERQTKAEGEGDEESETVRCGRVCVREKERMCILCNLLSILL